MQSGLIRTRFLLISVVLALVFTGAAWAKGKCGHVTKGNGSVAVYVEQIPTSCGSKPVHHASLPSGAGGAGGTGSAGGSGGTGHSKSNAPSYPSRAQNRKGRGDLRTQRGGNALSASVGSLGGGSGTRLILVLGIMGGTAFGVFGFSFFRRRGFW